MCLGKKPSHLSSSFTVKSQSVPKQSHEPETDKRQYKNKNKKQTWDTWEIWDLSRGERASWKRKLYGKKKEKWEKTAWETPMRKDCICKSLSGRDVPRGSLHGIKTFTGSKFCLSVSGHQGEEKCRRCYGRLHALTLTLSNSKDLKTRQMGSVWAVLVVC